MKVMQFKHLAIGDKFKIPGQEYNEWKKIDPKKLGFSDRTQYNAMDEQNGKVVKVNLLRKVYVPPYEDRPEPKYFSPNERMAYAKANKLVQSKGWKNMREVTRAIADELIEIPQAPVPDIA